MSDFLEDMRNDHRDFDYGKLEEVFGDNPFIVFNEWLQRAIAEQQLEANAFSLSTVNAENQPSARIVYLKEILNEQFVFYTNYGSHKGKDLELNPKVNMLFFWAGLMRQVRVEGTVSKVDSALSDDYFNSRPRGSQIGAWASLQSTQLMSRKDLEDRVVELNDKYPTIVPRPENWGGYAITPTKIEFWQGRPSRLHDRIVFEKVNGDWVIYRLNP